MAYKNTGVAASAGNQLWADDVNSAGGICGRTIGLESVDHDYRADTAKALYPQLEPKSPRDGADARLADPGRAQAEPERRQHDRGARLVVERDPRNPNIMMIGTTYDLEVINGLSYFQQQGMLADGDTIGHIYVDGEYGAHKFDAEHRKRKPRRLWPSGIVHPII